MKSVYNRIALFAVLLVCLLGYSISCGRVAKPASPRQLPTPVISPESGTYDTGSLTITIECAASGESIYYTVDGSAPVNGDPSLLYSNPFIITSSRTIRAKAYKIGSTESEIASSTYYLSPTTAATPTISPETGQYTGTVLVTLECSTPEVDIYYTLDGTTPTNGGGTSTLYTPPYFELTTSKTVKARAFRVDLGDSATAVATIDIFGWETLDDGMAGGGQQVFALMVDEDGTLYAGGAFTAAGGVPASNIAKWDGSSWSAVGNGFDGTVNAIFRAPNGSLYAGGEFNNSGATPTSKVACWNGDAWVPLADGVQTGTVYALGSVGSGNLVVAGNYTYITNRLELFNNIAQWTGTTWETMDSGLGDPSSGDEVYTLATDASGNLYAGGDIYNFTPRYFAKWSGTAWVATGLDLNSRVYGITHDSNDVRYVTGGFSRRVGVTDMHYVAKWGGTQWMPLTQGTFEGIGIISDLRCLTADHSGNVYFGGSFTETGAGLPVNNIVKWTGTTFEALGTGTNNYVRALAAGPDGSIYAGGDFTTAGGLTCNYIAKWAKK